MKKIMLVAVGLLYQWSLAATSVLLSPNTVNHGTDVVQVVVGEGMLIGEIAAGSALGKQREIPTVVTETPYGSVEKATIKIIKSQTQENLGVVEISVIRFTPQELQPAGTVFQARVSAYGAAELFGGMFNRGRKVGEFEQGLQVNESTETDVLNIQLAIFQEGLTEHSLTAQYIATPMTPSGPGD